MASRWQQFKHGVIIATGVSLTGATIYFGADRDYVTSEDLIEIQMAVIERQNAVNFDFGPFGTNTYSITNQIAVLADTDAEWYAYDATDNVITNLYRQSTGAYNNQVTTLTNVIGFQNTHFTEYADTGDRRLLSGWESLTVSGFDGPDLNGVYAYEKTVLNKWFGTVDIPTAYYTNTLGGSTPLMIYCHFDKQRGSVSEYASFGFGSAQWKARRDRYNIFNHSILDLNVWSKPGEPDQTNVTITPSAEILQHAIIDAPVFEIYQYHKPTLGPSAYDGYKIDVRSQSLPDGVIARWWTFPYYALFNTIDYSGKTDEEIQQDAWEGLSGDDPFSYLTRAFCAYPVGNETEMSELFATNKWLRFQDQGWGTNDIYTQESSGEVYLSAIDTTWINDPSVVRIWEDIGGFFWDYSEEKKVPRIRKPALLDRYDAIQELGNVTTLIRGDQITWTNVVAFEWRAESTNSVEEAMQNAVVGSGVPTNSWFGVPARVGRVTRTFPESGVTNWVAAYQATIAQPKNTNPLYDGITKSISFWGRFRKQDRFVFDLFYSEEGYNETNYFAFTQGHPHAMGKADQFYTGQNFPFEIAPNTNWFNPNVGGAQERSSKGWIVNAYTQGGFPITANELVITKWDFEYAITPRE